MLDEELTSGLSTRSYFERLCLETHPVHAFAAETEEAWRAWRVDLVKILADLVGPFPDERCPLNPRVVERVRQPAYMRERIVFQSEPNVLVSAHLLLPYARQDSSPAVLCLHGHGRGKDDVAGIAPNPQQRQRRIRPLHYDYGHQLAERGYVVFIPDARAFGERGSDGMSCNWATTSALLLGKTLVGLRVWDAMRSIDYLQSRADVDSDRIACAGLSWGGTHTMYTAALDERIQVAIISGAFGTFKDSLLDASECACQYVPRLMQYAELPDIVSLIAPRPLLIESGLDDQHYTIEVVHEAYRRVQHAYHVASADERVDIDVFAGGHRFNGEKAFPWIERWL